MKTTKKCFAIEACMDEDVWVDGIKFGVVASSLTRMHSGNQTVYPDRMRKNMESLRPHIHNGLIKLSEFMNCYFGVSSHPGCGGAAAQGIAESTISNLTKTICGKLDVSYVGHVAVSDQPERIGSSGCRGNITRGEDSHYHKAKSVIVSIGGGITKTEKEGLIERCGGNFFEVSADWVFSALDGGAKIEDIADWLMLHLNIAKEIAQKVNGNKRPITVFNAGRLDKKPKWVQKNKVMVDNAFPGLISSF